MGKMDEQILVVSREQLFDGDKLTFQGTVTGKAIVDTLLHNIEEDVLIMRRGDAEQSPAFKQPIPYVLIKRGDRFFCYERLKGGGEERLHSNLSLGVGGHMNSDPDAVSFLETIETNMWRELNEELLIGGQGEPHVEIIGILNDDTNEVGRVHVCILAMLVLPEEATVIVRETEQLKGSWATMEDLTHQTVFSRLENWSQIAIQALQA